MDHSNTIVFNDFFHIVDYYLDNTNMLNTGTNGFNCEYGSIEFIKLSSSNVVIIHEIYVKTQYRNKGMCKDFIKYLIDKLKNKQKIIIRSVLSKILYEFLLRFEYAQNKFVINKEGFVYTKI